MNNIAEAFEKKINQYGIKKQVDAAMICEAFNQSVLEVFGEMGQKNVRAISFKNDVLKVGVTSSSWASEVGLTKKSLLNKEVKRATFEIINF